MSGVLSSLNPEEHLFNTVNVNFYTSSIALLSALEAPLQKRTGSTYGPPGAAKMVYFVDDLNLPEVDAYNTQVRLWTFNLPPMRTRPFPNTVGPHHHGIHSQIQPLQ